VCCRSTARCAHCPGSEPRGHHVVCRLTTITVGKTRHILRRQIQRTAGATSAIRQEKQHDCRARVGRSTRRRVDWLPLISITLRDLRAPTTSEPTHCDTSKESSGAGAFCSTACIDEMITAECTQREHQGCKMRSRGRETRPIVCDLAPIRAGHKWVVQLRGCCWHCCRQRKLSRAGKSADRVPRFSGALCTSEHSAIEPLQDGNKSGQGRAQESA
jgi:hypothetical protein